MINPQYIKLNMTPSGVLPVLHCSQYDIGRPLGFVVYNGAEAVDLDDYTVTIEATRSDDVAITAAATTDGNIGVFATTATMTNKADRYPAQCVLVDGSSNRVASLPFMMFVVPAAMDENAESIEEDASLYQQYNASIGGLIAQIRSSINQNRNAIADNATEIDVLSDRIDNMIALQTAGSMQGSKVTTFTAQSASQYTSSLDWQSFSFCDYSLHLNTTPSMSVLDGLTTPVLLSAGAYILASHDASITDECIYVNLTDSVKFFNHGYLGAAPDKRAVEIAVPKVTDAAGDISGMWLLFVFSVVSDVPVDLSELTDIRIGADGTTYPSAGDAVRGQVSDLKEDLSSITENDYRTIYLSSLAFEQYGYVNTSGAFATTGTAHKIVKMNASDIRKISYKADSSLAAQIAFGVIKDSGGNVKRTLSFNGTSEVNVNLTPANGDTLYISFMSAETVPNPYYDAFEVVDYADIVKSYGLIQYTSQTLTEEQKAQARTNIFAADSETVDELNSAVFDTISAINLSSLQTVQNGYINGDGVFTNPTSPSHKIVKIDASRLKYIEYTPLQGIANSIAFGVLKDENDNNIQVFKCDNTTNKKAYSLSTKNGYTLYISYLNYATVPNPYYSTFGAKYKNAEEIKYRTCAKKPFDFSGKNLFFFGDSITYGYIAESGGTPAHQATNQYPKLFSQGVGATHTNYGESGTTLAVVSGYGSIYTKIQNTTLTGADVVFIAGGVNDWQVGVNEATLKTAVENICTYLSNNFNGEVIWITPIYEAGRVPIVTPTQTLQNVRNVITRVALKYGYSVVQGWEFPFPQDNDDSDYIALMFQDKIHPTELGYSMFAQSLRGALC